MDFNARTLLMALQIGEPHRLVRVFAMESIFAAFRGGPGRRRAERLLGLTTALAVRLGDPTDRAWALCARGLVEYYAGHFAAAAGWLDQAEALLRESCRGMAWELDTVRLLRLLALFYMGRIGEMARSVPQHVAEALDRGDLYSATNLSLSFLNSAWLVRDDVTAARRVAAEAAGRWSHKGFHVQHWYALTAEVQLHLYAGDGAAALACVRDRWTPLQRSLLTHLQIVRVEARVLRARCALAAAATGRGDRAALLREAERYAVRVRREGMAWSTPLADLLLAGVAAARGEPAAALRRLETAVAGCAAAGLPLWHVVAQRRQGELCGGAKGAALREAADAWLTAQTIRAPERWAAMLAPGFPA